jgi:hypothetical protein
MNSLQTRQVITSQFQNNNFNNKQRQFAESENQNKIQNFVQEPQNLKPIRIHTNRDMIQQRNSKFPAGKIIEMKSKAPKNNVNSKSHNEINLQDLAKNQKESYLSKEPAKKENCIILSDEEKLLRAIAEAECEQPISNSHCIILLSDEEKMRRAIAEAECEQPISNKKTLGTGKEDGQIFSAVCKEQKTQKNKVTPQNEKKIAAVQIILEPKIQDLKARRDSFLTCDFGVDIDLTKPIQVDPDFMEKIRYSQRTVSNIMTSNESLVKFQEKLKREGFKEDGAIIVVKMPDGMYTSFDNRRLYCARKVAKVVKDFKIFVQIKHYDDCPDEESLDYHRSVYYDTRKYFYCYGNDITRYGLYGGVSSGTWGELIQARIILFLLDQYIFPKMRHGIIREPIIKESVKNLEYQRK